MASSSLVLLFLLILSSLIFTSFKFCDAQERVVAGYLPDYRGYINIDNTAKHLTDLILFSLEPQPNGGLHGCCLNEDHYKKAKQARNLHKELKLWVSIGGGGRNAAFQSVAADPDKRSRLIESAVELCKRHELDGIDLDLYFPTSQEEHNRFVEFLHEATRYWRDKGLMISVALHPHNRLPRTAYGWIDRVHLMTYDMVIPGGNGHHASIANVRTAVDTLKGSGCPSQKIIVGVPFYARHVKNPGLVKTFAELYDMDERVERSKDLFRGYAFDTPHLIERKLQYIYKEEGLGGVFAWELGQDKQTDSRPGGVLLSALAGEYNTKKDKNSEL